ncbi:single-stranded DNA-binding protein [Rhodopseudomonas sp. B29]|uniref:single-stranded DNA-binding protein n=1 Tax=Rhodopseudomonas sp. B29 TaxID=95607 RepID=UPI0003457ED9|nr:single-stranded DNA-binding protein [Rhodopseudomonas sp. B29]
MSGSVNKVILIGHLGADPDVKRNGEGKPIATLRLATGETWRDRATGERKERTEWHRVVIFNEGLAKIAEQYLKKGSKVYIEGQLSTRKWTDQGGAERWTTEVVLSAFNCSMQLLDRREGGGVPSPQGEEDYGTTRDRAAAGGSLPSRNSGGISSGRADLDDDIPF